MGNASKKIVKCPHCAYFHFTVAILVVVISRRTTRTRPPSHRLVPHRPAFPPAFPPPGFPVPPVPAPASPHPTRAVSPARGWVERSEPRQRPNINCTKLKLHANIGIGRKTGVTQKRARRVITVSVVARLAANASGRKVSVKCSTPSNDGNEGCTHTHTHGRQLKVGSARLATNASTEKRGYKV